MNFNESTEHVTSGGPMSAAGCDRTYPADQDKMSADNREGREEVPVEDDDRYETITKTHLCDWMFLESFSICSYTVSDITKPADRASADLCYQCTLVNELLALSSDVYCLQGITADDWMIIEDNFDEWGYDSIRKEKGSGFMEAIFFNRKMFQLMSERTAFIHDDICEFARRDGVPIDLMSSVNSNEVNVCVVLRLRDNGKCLLVANITCIEDGKGRPDLASAQICATIRKLKVLGSECGATASIVCGAFYCLPQSQVYQVVSEGSPDHATERVFQAIKTVRLMPNNHQLRMSLIDMYPGGFAHDLSTLKSAYAVTQGEEPGTFWVDSVKRTMPHSYMLFNNEDLDVVSTLNLPRPELYQNSGLPNAIFPSVALSQRATFMFREPDTEEPAVFEQL